MVLRSIKRDIENILASIYDDDFIPQQDFKEKGDFLSEEDVNHIYSIVADFIGNENTVIIGGAALQRYSKHKPKDLDLLINADTSKLNGYLLSSGFYGYEKLHTPFFRADSERYLYDRENKTFVLEVFTADKFLGKKYSFEQIINSANADRYNDHKIYYVDLDFLVRLKYMAWNNRLFNARADKDLQEISSCEILDKVNDETKNYVYRIVRISKEPYQRFISALSGYMVKYARNLLRR